MKRLLLLLCILVFIPPCESKSQFRCARLSPPILSGGIPGCGPTSEPAGDMGSDGFEGSGSGGMESNACGTAFCYTTSGAVTTNYALSGLSGGTGDTHNCNYGLQTAWAESAKGVAFTHANTADFYVEFSMYIDSSSLSTDDVMDILYLGCSSLATNPLATLKLIQIEGGYYFYISGASGAPSSGFVADDTWYYFRIHVSDNAQGSCAIGTTYNGTDIMNETFNCNDRTSMVNTAIYLDLQEGSGTALTLVFGYIALDDDGTF